MRDDRPPVLVPATPEYVLDVFGNDHRRIVRCLAGQEPDRPLTFETTVAEWQTEIDLVASSRWIGRALNDIWQLGRPDADWRAVLEPARERTLGELCEFIASGARMRALEPLAILGRPCLPAGAFLAIRSLLIEAGADVEGVSPSTSLDEYVLRHRDVFQGPISRLAPASLPIVLVHRNYSWHDAAVLGRRLGHMTAFVGKFLSPIVMMAGLLLALVSYVGSWITVPPDPREWVEFGPLQTFRDLSYAVADGAWVLEE
ncbi:hypothetical protein OJF2_10180 [Aquisphaera giovannonii]|uniref:Uncharacterized protein n=1 Tax=Aquisphaera giovannonii TaxID=406548 RepID=A0A5B9VXF1_9BACT|nr:hypothetical protein [Aquisphaera giovannonii]QEH32541.1 hypothetical protein OJF2_10180 [Aquisphaera giovannonii]